MLDCGAGANADVEPTTAHKNEQGSRARATAFSLEPHCCRVCFGRIASSIEPDGRRHWLCTVCGTSAHGESADVVCACGIRLKRGKADTVDAGVRCHENPSPSPEFPALFVASYRGANAR